jgi:hypothetical protein
MWYDASGFCANDIRKGYLLEVLELHHHMATAANGAFHFQQEIVQHEIHLLGKQRLQSVFRSACNG